MTATPFSRGLLPEGAAPQWLGRRILQELKEQLPAALIESEQRAHAEGWHVPLVSRIADQTLARATRMLST